MSTDSIEHPLNFTAADAARRPVSDSRGGKRKSILSPEQKSEMAELRDLGFTNSQARWRVLTSEQRQTQARQIRNAEQFRYLDNPQREIITQARNAANSACTRGVRHGAHEFTITKHDLIWPTYCPVLGLEIHYPGHYRGDPAGASLERLDVTKGYVPSNVMVVSLRANLLRKDATAKELRLLADCYSLLID